MGLELGTYINSLVATNPVGAVDPKSQGDNHLRLIKATILATFPNLTGAMTADQTELNYLDGATGVTGTGNTVRSASPTFTGTVTAATVAATTLTGAGSGITALSATNLASGTVPDARFPATLPAASGVNLTALNATNLASGSVADARLSANVPLLNASNTFTGQNRIAAGEAASLIVDKTGSSVGRLKAFIGSGSSYTADDAYISALNTTLHFLSGASGTTGVFDIGATGNFDFKSGTVTTNNTSASEVGFKGVPQNLQNGDYTLVLADAGKTIYKDSGGSGETITIPANGSVAFPIGTAVTIINNGGGTLSVAIATDTLVLAGAGTTGTRTLASYGVATITKVSSTGWFITGAGLS